MKPGISATVHARIYRDPEDTRWSYQVSVMRFGGPTYMGQFSGSAKTEDLAWQAIRKSYEVPDLSAWTRYLDYAEWSGELYV